MEAEFQDYDRNEKWRKIFRNVSSMSQTFPSKEARKVENKTLNRYMDVVPYDNTRVKLERYKLNYINASYVCVPAAKRKYILTQGPLPNTSGHFWLMVWEQNSRVILMLNNLIEGGTIKCHKYWPDGKDRNDIDEMNFKDVSLIVRLKSYEKFDGYILRKFILYDCVTQNSREISHFHYITWPDFDLPRSSDSFLEFLTAVRKSGCFTNEHGPPVIHCSAGIGRSGTVALVDSCLLMIEKNKCRDSINIIDVLLEMRTYRMGLIQTSDQLRFSFLAILEGSKKFVSDPQKVQQNTNNNIASSCSNANKIKRSFGVDEKSDDDNVIDDQDDNNQEDDDDDDDDDSDSDEEDEEEDEEEESETTMTSTENDCNIKEEIISNSNKSKEENNINIDKNKLRQRNINQNNDNANKEREREEKRQRTLAMINRIKAKQKEMEERLKLNHKLYNYFKTASICIGIVIILGVCIYYKQGGGTSSNAANNPIRMNYD